MAKINYAFLFIVMVVGSACSDGIPEVQNAGLSLTVTFEAQKIEFRKIAERNIQHVYSLSGPADSLFTPRGFWIGDDGTVFVSDYGDFRIKAFDSTGVLLGVYGAGLGRGPGQFASITDVKTVGDSLLVVVDGSGRRITIFSSDQDIVRSIGSDSLLVRSAITESGSLIAFMGQTSNAYMRTLLLNPEERRYFGKLAENAIQHRMLLQGQIDAFEEDVIYASTLMPLIVKHGSNGDVLFSRLAVGYKDFQLPEYDTQETPVGLARNVRSTTVLQRYVVASEPYIYISTVPNGVDDVSYVDVYEGMDGTYVETLAVEKAYPYIISNGKYIVGSDGVSVDVYSVTSTE